MDVYAYDLAAHQRDQRNEILIIKIILFISRNVCNLQAHLINLTRLIYQ